MNPAPAELRALVDELHARIGPPMLSMLAKRTGSPLIAEDLAQRTWSALWKTVSEGRYDPARASLSTLAYAIAFNMWREHARARPGPQSSDDLDRVLGPSSDPAATLGHAELIDRVRSAFTDPASGLDPADARVLRLIAGGASDRDIAANLGVAPSTANVRKRAALDALRKHLLAERPDSGAQSTTEHTP